MILPEREDFIRKSESTRLSMYDYIGSLPYKLCAVGENGRIIPK